MFPKEFFILPEELFRLGNADTPKLSHIRARDIDTVIINDVIVVKANGKGISVFDKVGINESPMTGWVWRFPPHTKPPLGLKLVQDKAHHFCIAPEQNMPIEKYKRLLEEMTLLASRVFKKEGKVV